MKRVLANNKTKINQRFHSSWTVWNKLHFYMEEEKNETKKDSPAPKLNALERLIKLDRKNSSLTLVDKNKK